MIDVRAAYRTDVGRARDQNEDACFAGRRVFAVADGLGGHSAGEVASTLALESIEALDGMGAEAAASRIAEAVRKSNRAVFERAQKDAGLKGMGTTMTALVIGDDGIAHIAHVGDSRCYLVRGGDISQLSRDHTLVARMVAEGKLTREQAEAHPQRSILTRALGADRDVDVEETRVALVPGDRIILCSDGLTSVLSDEEIRLLASDGADLDEISQALIDEANARGGPDNITAIVVDIGGSLPAERFAVEKHRPRTTDRVPERRVPVRLIIWVLLLTALALGGIVGVRSWAHRSYFVGRQDAHVVIFRGLPVEFAGIRLFEPAERTDIRVDQIRNPAVRRSLDDGIRADSLEEARRIIDERIRPNTPRGRGEPEGDASPTPTAGPDR